MVNISKTAKGSTKSAKEEVVEQPHAKTTYYNAFPRHPRPQCSLAAVFWVIEHDHRSLNRDERRNVVYPAKSAGLIAEAPTDNLDVQINLKGETSRCQFILTTKGQEYFQQCVLPALPTDFTSPHPQPKRRRKSGDMSLADIKAGK